MASGGSSGPGPSGRPEDLVCQEEAPDLRGAPERDNPPERNGRGRGGAEGSPKRGGSYLSCSFNVFLW